MAGMEPQAGFSMSHRRRLAESLTGLTIESADWTDDGGGYWVIRFTDGSSILWRHVAGWSGGVSGDDDAPGGLA